MLFLKIADTLLSFDLYLLFILILVKLCRNYVFIKRLVPFLDSDWSAAVFYSLYSTGSMYFIVLVCKSLWIKASSK